MWCDHGVAREIKGAFYCVTHGHLSIEPWSQGRTKWLGILVLRVAPPATV